MAAVSSKAMATHGFNLEIWPETWPETVCRDGAVAGAAPVDLAIRQYCPTESNPE